MAPVSSEAKLIGLQPDSALMKQCCLQYGLTIESVFLCAPPIGGDLWGLLPVDEDRLAIFCLDVCGHGAEVAPHTEYVHDLLHSPGLNISDPSVVLYDLNTCLHTFLPRGHFVAMWYGVIDTKRNTLNWAASTFLPQLYSECAAVGFYPLPGEGVPLGFLAESNYVCYCRPFYPGSQLILYSDALAETPLPPDSVFTVSSLCEFVNRLIAKKPVGYIAEALIDRLDLQHNPLVDDLTIVRLFRNQSNGCTT